MPDEAYRRARVRAAEQDTSVTALVREFLLSLGGEESDFEARKRLQRQVLATVRNFRASDRLPRGQAHDRNALR